MTKNLSDLPFAEVWALDSEYIARPGEIYDPVCSVAVEARTGQTIRLWRDEMGAKPPYRVDNESLIICYAAHAEMGVHLALGWPLPVNVLDLHAEFRNNTNGRTVPAGRGLLGALTSYGLKTIGALTKDGMRERIMAGWPFAESEKPKILDYCQSDSDALLALLPHLLPSISLRHALLRGEFVKASALMEFRGVPIDADTFAYLRDQDNWDRFRETLVPAIDTAYQVYDNKTFKRDRFDSYVKRERLPWPRLETGQLDLKDKTFRSMAKAYPQIAPLHELRHTLSKLRKIKLTVGADSRNRTVLWPFKSKTGRTQPKATEGIFGPSVWLRSLIAPPSGRAVAYVDYSAMEFGIAAALSGDRNMLAAYESGDPYLSFAKMAGAAPAHATRATHEQVRDVYKVVILATQYGMSAPSLAGRLGVHRIKADELLNQHRNTFGRYWHWSDGVVQNALITGRMHTVFGWTFYLDGSVSARTIRNWPVQSHGAEILRVACVLAMRHDLALLAPVHDALLVESDTDRLELDVARVQEIMRRASRIVLNPYDPAAATLDGFTLRTDATIVRYPHRYSDKRGVLMWKLVTGMIEQQRERKLA